MAYTLEEITIKIRKLLMNAQDKTKTEAESAAFAAKAQELMQAYNVEHIDIHAPQVQIEMFHHNLLGKRLWHRRLLSILCHTGFCRYVLVNNTEIICLFGEKHNADLVWSLYLYLVKELERRAKEKHTQYSRYNQNVVNANTWNINFYTGALDSLYRRLDDQFQSMQSARSLEPGKENIEAQEIAGYIAPIDPAKMRALIVIQSNAVDLKIKEIFNNVKDMGSTRSKTKRSDGYQAGVTAGKQIELNKAIG